MRFITILLTIGLFINFRLVGQNITITGRILTEYLEELPFVRILSKERIILGETAIDGRFIITIPQKTDTLLFMMIGMESTTIQLLPGNCDNIEVIMMYNVIYDFMSARKIDRLRIKRFNKLPELYHEAFEKGLFKNEEPCFKQNFDP